MRGLRLFCLILGILNIIAGLLSYPLGFGAYSVTSLKVTSNYQRLIDEHKVTEAGSDGNGTQFGHLLMRGTEPQFLGRSVFTVVGLVAQGIVLIGAAMIARGASSRPVVQATPAG